MVICCNGNFLRGGEPSLKCICYYTFWSGVAARGGRADKPQHHDKRCLLPLLGELLSNPRSRTDN